MTLPFELPTVSRGFALLGPGAKELGARAAVEVARALTTLVGAEVAVTGRPLPCVPTPTASSMRLRIELAALPGTATLEVEARLGAALLDRLCGGAGAVGPATEVTPLERVAVELATLSALDALSALPPVERGLAPRLARQAGEPIGGLAVDVDVALAGGACGRVRVVLPAAALRAVAEGHAPAAAAEGLAIPLSLRSGSAPLRREELEGLAPGDVVLTDPPPPGRLFAVAPGGLRVVCAESDDGLLVEEIRMPETQRSEWPIEVEVELARVPITLAELSRLEPGAVLPLPIDRRGTVTLKLGERGVARGQLVDVEGSVGVRIDSLVGGP